MDRQLGIKIGMALIEHILKTAAVLPGTQGTPNEADVALSLFNKSKGRSPEPAHEAISRVVTAPN